MGELAERILSHVAYFNAKIKLVPSSMNLAGHTPPSNTGNNGFIFKKKGIESYKVKRNNPDTANESDEMEDDEEEEEGEEEEEQEIGEEENTKTADLPLLPKQPDILPGFIDSEIVTEREELKKRLREKLNALRAKRNAPPLADDAENAQVQPPSKKRKVEDKKSKKKKKKQKGQPAKQKTPSTPNTPNTNKNSTNTTPKSKPNTPAKNSDDATIEFSTFDFSSGAPVPTYLQNKKKPSKAQLLKKVQDQKQILHQLHGTEQGDSLARQQAWETMKKKAQGEKIKNDPEKLKKSIKRDQAQKKKSKRDWDQRVTLQKKSQKEAQKKRLENIEKVKERKREKRMGIKRKKSPSSSTKDKRRGFEGERNQYLNK